MNLASARRRFFAALALYLIWVITLLGMAATTAERPPERLAPPPAGVEPARDAAPSP